MDRPLLSRRDLIAAVGAGIIASACRAATAKQVSLFDYLSAEQQRRIVGGKSDLDCAPILARALEDAIATEGVLWLPHGLYFVEPAQRLVHADRNFECLAAIRMTSGMRIAGEPGAILRIVPGFSTDQRPRATVMFGADAAITDIAISTLELDMNGRANPISPGRVSGDFSRLPQAQIFVSSPDGVPAARVDRARIADVTFRDANGVSCIVMAQTSDPAASLGRGWTVERCVFEENGLDTDDHSSIFAYAEDVTIDRCRFTNKSPFNGTGVNTAIEVHGARQRIARSTFSNMMRGIWVANNYSALTSNTAIVNNDFRTLFYGVDFFHDRSSAQGITDTQITGNRFTFDDRVIASLRRLDMKAAVQIASEYGQRGITISGNRVLKQGHAITSAFLVVTGGFKGARRHDAIVATGNSGEGLTFGSFLRTTAAAGLGRLSITRNQWRALAPSTMMTIAAGDVVEHTGKVQPIEALALGGGSAEPAKGSGSVVKGVFLNGFVRSLAIEPIQGYGEDCEPVFRGGAARIGTIEQRRP